MQDPLSPLFAMRMLWIGAGCVALALGALGVVLPVLPTTPFVLLAAFCFGKGSTRLRNWLVGNRTFGPLIADWEMYGVIPRRAKIAACSVMAATFIVSVLLMLKPLILVIQALCMGGAAAYVLTRPSAAP